MLPEKRIVHRKGKAKKGQDELPKYRETPMTQPEPRLYKEVFRSGVKINHLHSENHFAHTAPQPEPHPRAEVIQRAAMMKPSTHMFPNETDKDTFVGGSKRTDPSKNQFATSSTLYGDEPERPSRMKMSTVKIAEIGGSGIVKPLSHTELQSQQLQTFSAAKQSAVIGVHGSRGASDVLAGYRDNDVTHNLVNAKHNNPAVLNPPA